MKIKKNLAKILQVEFVRFGIVGLIATAIHYSIYCFLCILMNSTVAYTIGYLISFCCNFALSSKFTFRTKVKAGLAGYAQVSGTSRP